MSIPGIHKGLTYFVFSFNVKRIIATDLGLKQTPNSNKRQWYQWHFTLLIFFC